MRSRYRWLFVLSCAFAAISITRLFSPASLLADNPTLNPCFFCEPQMPTCPSQLGCPNPPGNAYYCLTNGSNDTGLCYGPDLNTCADFGLVNCGYQTQCANPGVYTTSPPTNCTEQTETCQTVQGGCGS